MGGGLRGGGGGGTGKRRGGRGDVGDAATDAAAAAAAATAATAAYNALLSHRMQNPLIQLQQRAPCAGDEGGQGGDGVLRGEHGVEAIDWRESGLFEEVAAGEHVLEGCLELGGE